MKLSELVAAVTEQTGQSEREVAKTLKAVFPVILGAVQTNERVVLPKLGVFVRRKLKTGETRVLFKPST